MLHWLGLLIVAVPVHSCPADRLNDFQGLQEMWHDDDGVDGSVDFSSGSGRSYDGCNGRFGGVKGGTVDGSGDFCGGKIEPTPYFLDTRPASMVSAARSMYCRWGIQPRRTRTRL